MRQALFIKSGSVTPGNIKKMEDFGYVVIEYMVDPPLFGPPTDPTPTGTNEPRQMESK